MDRTAWDREVDEENEGMEREHGLQVSLLEALEGVIAGGGDPAAVAEILDRLRSFSDVHFGSEELLMRLHSYPRYRIHVEEHHRLVEALDALQAEHAKGSAVLEQVRSLKLWLAGHIDGMDADFAAHTGGVAGAPV